MLVQHLGTSILYEVYALNQQVFVELFCINKDKPEMHCDGTCMISMLYNQDNQDAEKPMGINIAQLQSFFYEEFMNFGVNILYVPCLQNHFYHVNINDSQFIDKIWRPPIMV